MLDVKVEQVAGELYNVTWCDWSGGPRNTSPAIRVLSVRKKEAKVLVENIHKLLDAYTKDCDDVDVAPTLINSKLLDAYTKCCDGTAPSLVNSFHPHRYGW